MSIKYVLRKNRLVDRPDIYSGSVRISGSVDLQEIADRIVEQGTTVRRPDVLAVLENAIMTADTLLQDGFRVNFGGLCDLFPKMTGSFNGPDDTYDPARHRVDVAAVAGTRIRSSIRMQANVERQQAVKPVPDLVGYESTGTGAGGTIGTIRGYRLKFDATRADEGIFFVATSDGFATRIDPANIQNNKPKKLVFVNPVLAAGTYWLEVRTRYTADGDLRTGRLDGTVSF